jgi:hypothetical protein
MHFRITGLGIKREIQIGDLSATAAISISRFHLSVIGGNGYLKAADVNRRRVFCLRVNDKAWTMHFRPGWFRVE